MSKRKLFYAAWAAQKRANPCGVREFARWPEPNLTHAFCRLARYHRKQMIEDSIMVGLLQLHTAFSRIQG